MTAAAIILAAGASTRMGESKQMLNINGQTLLVKTIQTVFSSGIRKVVVVLGSNESAHRTLIDHLPVETVYNPQWEKGMGSSIKRGVAHLTSHAPFPQAILVLVCDQPLLRSGNILNLLNKYRESNKPIIASRYSGMPGVPVLFDKTYYNRLLTLPDEQGAKKILLENQDDVYEIDFPEGQIDLDTRADYEAFIDGKS